MSAPKLIYTLEVAKVVCTICQDSAEPTAKGCGINHLEFGFPPGWYRADFHGPWGSRCLPVCGACVGELPTESFHPRVISWQEEAAPLDAPEVEVPPPASSAGEG